MPTYSYRCQECSENFTAMKTIAQRDDISGMSCPKCGSISVTRVWPQGASIGLAFKGDGFYITDYKRNKESGVSPSGVAPPAPSNS